jgi:molybdate transport system regulatory protein
MEMPTTKVQGRLWLSTESQQSIGRGRIDLLAKIGEFGSIAKAAKAMKMSYKAAWDAVDMMNNLSPELLVMRSTGGKGGGGTQLTDYGKMLIMAFRELESEHQQFLTYLEVKFSNMQQLQQLMRKLTMQTSARNQFLGTVIHIKRGPVNCEVTLQLKGQEVLVAVITENSVENLGLVEGKQVYALIKAPLVTLMPADSKLKISARNRLCGKVTHVLKGTVNAEVTLELTGGTVLKAVVTEGAVADLAIQPGSALCAFFKASTVTLAVEE